MKLPRPETVAPKAGALSRGPSALSLSLSLSLSLPSHPLLVGTEARGETA